jgi:hypothetical protein
VQHVVMLGRTAVVVRHWFEVGPDADEHGARIEIRLLDWLGSGESPFAARRVTLGTPVFRADLFDLVDGPPGNMASAHWHPGFEGTEPISRTWDEELSRSPFAWLERRLADPAQLFVTAGLPPGQATEEAAAEVRRLAPAAVALARVSDGAHCPSAATCLELTSDTTAEVERMLEQYRGGAPDPRRAASEP